MKVIFEVDNKDELKELEKILKSIKIKDITIKEKSIKEKKKDFFEFLQDNRTKVKKIIKTNREELHER